LRLARIKVRRLPGVDGTFRVDLPPDAGLVLVTGPNASGKSSLCRAVRATLWPDADEWSAKGKWRDWREGCDVDTAWQLAGSTREAQLARGGVRWQMNGADVPSPMLPPKELSRCWSIGIADLLVPEDSTADELARRIRVAMAGGYDLASLTFSEPGRQAKVRAKALRAAIQAIGEAKARHHELAGREDDMARLRAKLDDARRARAEQGIVEVALDLVSKRQTLVAAEAELGMMPAELAQIDNDAVEQFDARRNERASKEQESGRWERKAADASRRLSDAGFGDVLPDAERLDECRERLVASEKLFGRAREVEREKTAARQRLADASRVLIDVVAGEVLEGSTVTDAELALVDEWLGRRGEVAAELAGLRQFVLRLKREREREPLPDADAKILERRAERLSTWLKLATEPVPDSWLGARWAALSVSILAALSTLQWPRVGVVASLIALLALAFLLTRRRRSLTDERRVIEQDLGQLGLSDDPPWSSARAAAELGNVEAALAATNRVATFRDEEERADAAATVLAKQFSELDEHRGGLAGRLRVSSAGGDVRLRDVVARIAEWRRAHGDLNRASADAEAADQQLAAELDRLGALLERLGGSRPDDIPQAKAVVKHLDDRARDARQAQEDLRQAKSEVQRCAREIGALDDTAIALLARAGIPGEPSIETRAMLHDRVKLLGRFKQLSDEVTGLKAQSLEAQTRLARAGRSDLGAMSNEDLLRAKQEADAKAEGYEVLLGDISKIEANIASARSGSELEQARANEMLARDALQEIQQQSLDAALVVSYSTVFAAATSSRPNQFCSNERRPFFSLSPMASGNSWSLAMAKRRRFALAPPANLRVNLITYPMGREHSF